MGKFGKLTFPIVSRYVFPTPTRFLIYELGFPHANLSPVASISTKDLPTGWISKLIPFSLFFALLVAQYLHPAPSAWDARTGVGEWTVFSATKRSLGVMRS
jgi:hypothetical protein